MRNNSKSSIVHTTMVRNHRGVTRSPSAKFKFLWKRVLQIQPLWGRLWKESRVGVGELETRRAKVWTENQLTPTLTYDMKNLTTTEGKVCTINIS